ncbi:glycosyltransferase family 4 protein [Pelagicoccus sp. SDUM812003]|uniref:glycosyltransferase family 4 protein n=1 Tax=Pelagicoccus sp. SDUM812003 TaxID=3041267 RepID=UPI00280F0A73|nr:glycosyltransferase family 4 protein [Pelagicoccus sp. SDUM812003]MDQ8202374.1 glycosyltransferase family 4 protein [Pelagicoccus sp. SDUM812003]
MKRFYTNRDLIGDRYGRMFHLPRVLVERGWEVQVFCPDFHTREAFSREVEGIVFQSLPARLAGAWTKGRAWKDFEPDIWLASGQLIAARQARQVARTQGVPWAVDFYDYYPAFFPKWARSWADAWSHRLMASASGVIVASRSLGDWAARSNSNVLRLPNGIDQSLFHPRPKFEALKALGLDPRKAWVGYFGSLNPEHGLRETVEAIASLRSRGLDVGLVCAGRSNRLDLIEGVGAKWLGMLPQEKLAEAICACDCALAPYPDSDQIHFSNSCRLTEYVACSVPVVATRVGDHGQLLPENHPGWANPGDSESLADAIERQLHQAMLVSPPTSLDWSALGAKLDSFLTEVVKGRRAARRGSDTA